MKWILANDRTPDDFNPEELLNLKLLSVNEDVWIPTSGTFSKKDEAFYFEDGFNPRGKNEFNTVKWLDESPSSEVKEQQGDLDKRAEKILMSMMEENSPKLLQFFLSCLAKQMESANAETMDLSCELTIKNNRYKIESKSTLTTN